MLTPHALHVTPETLVPQLFRTDSRRSDLEALPEAAHDTAPKPDEARALCPVTWLRLRPSLE